MGVRESLQKLIDRKLAEAMNLEQDLRDTRVYIQALQDSLRLLPKEQPGDLPARSLRPGTAVALAQEVIKKAGRPLHISAILVALNKENTKENRVSLSGSLGGYAKDRRIFTRSGPNTFGLIEFGDDKKGALVEVEELPADFGKQ